MDIDMTLMGWFDVGKDEENNIFIRGQETNGNTFTIRTRRKREISSLIKELDKATADNKNLIQQNVSRENQ
jgi:hypothetical protein